MTNGTDLGRAVTPFRPLVGGSVAESRELDALDRRIIRILQKTGRMSNTRIAQELSVTETTVRKRIAQLMDDDMINIVAVPTPKAVGGNVSAIIGLSVDLRTIRSVSEQVRNCAEVRYVGLSAGRYDIMLEAFFRDQEHVLEFVTEQLGAMQGITHIETSLILKIAKFSYEWEMA
ncbi:Lrp/AsnC family transcriptional regulator, regulator for asnA, asnC and gidA [Geodermatophilus ruber]|uniref:Lrp/AsnC family transcriptional regulator, regulator for asnA, asnC and gidA n=2 Tax=Geodermatophilus ruber TaxID=504800 RepID=A0A1I4E2A8_9ACTN|nr:Lrp/AsnC family transcriptional regulator, regulator for asnA, asnC and gidA [Geodermatophilus ruber]